MHCLYISALLACCALDLAAAQQTPVGSAISATNLDRTFNSCYPPTAPATLSLSDYAGKVVVIATFYTGCAPGRFVAPDYAALSVQMAAQYGDDVVFLTSVKGSSSCSTWSAQKYGVVDGAPISIGDSDSALHYMLFDGNPQIAVLDKHMVVRRLEKGDAEGQGTAADQLQEFLNQPTGLPALIAELHAETLAAEEPAAYSGPSTITVTPGGDGGDGWIVAAYDDLTAYVGDQLVFNYAPYHDVRLLPANDCGTRSSAPELASASDSPFTYTLTEADVGETVFACSVGSHCQGGQKLVVFVQPTPVTMTLLEMLESLPDDYSVFVAALYETGLAAELSDDGVYTIFAPTNDAFGAFSPTEGFDVHAFGEEQARDILRYHITTGSLLADDLQDGMELPTAYDNYAAAALADEEYAPQAQNSVMVSRPNSGEVVLNDVCQVVQANLRCTNGVIHGIASVLMPPTEQVAVTPSCVSVFGRESAVQVFATADENLDHPSDLQFHPLEPNKLWISNRDTDSVTIIDVLADTATNRQDRAPYHYMEEIVSLAFDERGYFATCQESENAYNGMMVRNWFMGPTLFHSQESDLIDQMGESCTEADVADPDKTCFFTHYDMLHESPLCMGITHDPETNTPFGNVYWVFDGLNSTLIRYDFQEPHGPGSLDHSKASIRRYNDIELTRVPGIPGHMMMDPTERVLYVSDTGGNRVLRINPDSGHFIRNAKREFPIYSSIAETFEYSIWGCTEWDVFAEGIDKPSGLHVDGNYVYVSEHSTGRILAYDKVTMQRVSEYETGMTGLVGLEMDGEGRLLFVDGPTSTVSRLDVEASCPAGSTVDNQADIIVGGESGWQVRDYAPITAVVGQGLVFDYEPFHDVWQIDSEDAEGYGEPDCSFGSTSSRLAAEDNSPFRHSLDAAGTYTFSDSVGGHCGAGQVLSVTVVDSHVVWPERECTMVVDDTIFVDHSIHESGYMNISSFLDIDDYADAQLHHCGGGDITQGAAMAGMPTSGRINNDALLMSGYMCHVCLPSPCMNGGQCGHPHAWAFTCDCTGTGYSGDICQTPGEVESAIDCPGDMDGDLRVGVADILSVLASFGQFVEPGDDNAAVDFVQNGVVDVADILAVLGWFGVTCSADGPTVGGDGR